MAFTGNYTVTQTAAGTIELTDTSTGADATITTRHIFLKKYDTTTIVPSGTTTTYIDWPIANTTITLTGIFTQDWALNIEVIWVTATPTPGNTYDVTYLFVFNWFAYNQLGTLNAWELANPNLISDKQYMDNQFAFITFIYKSQIAVQYMSDIYASQYNLNQTTAMINNPTEYFY